MWTYDFVHAPSLDGRALRLLTIVNEFTPECLAIDVAKRLNLETVLERSAWFWATRGVPDHLRSDNGSEFMAHAVRIWSPKVDVEMLHVDPGSALENEYVQSVNGWLRDDLLNGEIFDTLTEAKMLIEFWRQHYNTVRSHNSLRYRPTAPEAI